MRDDDLRGMLRIFTGDPAARFIGYTGSRGYPRMDLVRDLVRRQHATGRPIVIVSGLDPDEATPDGQSRPRHRWGVDGNAIDQARRLGLGTLVLEPDWDAHGKAAGPLRNSQIVDQSDDVVAFWDGASRGTADTILKAWTEGKLRSVYGPTGERIAPDDAACRADAILARRRSRLDGVAV